MAAFKSRCRPQMPQMVIRHEQAPLPVGMPLETPEPKTMSLPRASAKDVALKCLLLPANITEPSDSDCPGLSVTIAKRQRRCSKTDKPNREQAIAMTMDKLRPLGESQEWLI